MNNTTTNNNNISNSNVKRTSYRGRSRSNSPASSVDSINRRRLTTNLNSSTKSTKFNRFILFFNLTRFCNFMREK